MTVHREQVFRLHKVQLPTLVRLNNVHACSACWVWHSVLGSSLGLLLVVLLRLVAHTCRATSWHARAECGRFKASVHDVEATVGNVG